MYRLGKIRRNWTGEDYEDQSGVMQVSPTKNLYIMLRNADIETKVVCPSGILLYYGNGMTIGL